MEFDLIIVNGDSYSDGAGVFEQYEYENKTEPNINKIGWTSFLADSLNIPIVNIALGGTSNKSIINRTLRFLENDEFYFHVDCAYPKIENFNLNDYKNILFITQWSYFHRFPIYIKNEYKDLSPNLYNGFEQYLNDSKLFKSYKDYFDLRFGIVYDDVFNGKSFVTDYKLYNDYLSTKQNITHINWPFVPFQNTGKEFVSFHRNVFKFVYEKIKQFPYTLIDNDSIKIDDLHTVRDETDGVINDSHIGLHSSKIIANRFVEYLKKEYGIQQIQMVDKGESEQTS